MKMRNMLAAVLTMGMVMGLALTANAEGSRRQVNITPVFDEVAGTKVTATVEYKDYEAGDYAEIYVNRTKVATDRNLADGYVYTLTAKEFAKYYGDGPVVWALNVEVRNAKDELKASRAWFQGVAVHEGYLYRTDKTPNFNTGDSGEYGLFNEDIARLINNYAVVTAVGNKRLGSNYTSYAFVDADNNLVIDTKGWLSFNYSSARALSKSNTPVTVKFTYNDRRYMFVIPARCDVTSYLNLDGLAGFLYLSEQLGRYDITNGTPKLVIPPIVVEEPAETTAAPAV